MVGGYLINKQLMCDTRRDKLYLEALCLYRPIISFHHHLVVNFLEFMIVGNSDPCDVNLKLISTGTSESGVHCKLNKFVNCLLNKH